MKEIWPLISSQCPMRCTLPITLSWSFLVCSNLISPPHPKPAENSARLPPPCCNCQCLGNWEGDSLKHVHCVPTNIRKCFPTASLVEAHLICSLLLSPHYCLFFLSSDCRQHTAHSGRNSTQSGLPGTPMVCDFHTLVSYLGCQKNREPGRKDRCLNLQSGPFTEIFLAIITTPPLFNFFLWRDSTTPSVVCGPPNIL